MEYSSLLSSPSFFLYLLKIDLSIAASCKSDGCMHCGGRLQKSDWKRAGFGLPPGVSKEVLVRHSFVCGSCKKRNTPNSLRWMYYRWFSSPTQFLIPILKDQVSKSEFSKFCSHLGVSPALLRRWQCWWSDTFFRSPYWNLCGIHRFPNIIPSINKLLSCVEASLSCAQDVLKELSAFFSKHRTERLWRLWPRSIEAIWGLSM